MAGQLLHAIGRGRTLTRSASPHPQLGDCGESTSLSRGGSVAMQAIFLPVTPAWTAGDGMGGPSLPPFIGAHRRLSRDPHLHRPPAGRKLSHFPCRQTQACFFCVLFSFFTLYSTTSCFSSPCLLGVPVFPVYRQAGYCDWLICPLSRRVSRCARSAGGVCVRVSE